VAEDYFAAMKRVEQRLEIAPTPKPESNNEDVKVQTILVEPESRAQVLFWVERLSMPKLGQQERLEIAENLKRELSIGYISQLSPPMVYAE
jgi:hypothetical protein